MKTAVSIPDPLFREAEALAKRLGISRSRLFARALEVYLEAHSDENLRQALDEVYAEQSSGLDEALAQMQWAGVPEEGW